MDLVEVAANFHCSNQPTPQRAPFAGGSVLVRVASVPEGDAIAHHWGGPEQACPLHRVLTKSIADRIDRRLQALVARAYLTGEQAHLPRARLRQPRESHTERAHLAPRLARGQELQRRSIDLLTGGDGNRQC